MNNQILEDLLSTLERNAINNQSKITNTSLYCKAWREQEHINTDYTLIMYNDTSDVVKFFTLEGNYSRFNNMMLDSIYSNKELEKEWHNLIYDENNNMKIEMTEDNSIVQSKMWQYFAHVTFLA